MSQARRMRRLEERRFKKMDPNHKMSPAQQAKAQAELEAKLREEHQLVFTKGELLIIFNVFTKINAQYGDFVNMKPIIDKIHPIIAVDSNIPKESQPLIVSGPNRRES